MRWPLRSTHVPQRLEARCLAHLTCGDGWTSAGLALVCVGTASPWANCDAEPLIAQWCRCWRGRRTRGPWTVSAPHGSACVRGSCESRWAFGQGWWPGRPRGIGLRPVGRRSAERLNRWKPVSRIYVAWTSADAAGLSSTVTRERDEQRCATGQYTKPYSWPPSHWFWDLSFRYWPSGRARRPPADRPHRRAGRRTGAERPDIRLLLAHC